MQLLSPYFTFSYASTEQYHAQFKVSIEETLSRDRTLVNVVENMSDIYIHLSSHCYNQITIHFFDILIYCCWSNQSNSTCQSGVNSFINMKGLGGVGNLRQLGLIVGKNMKIMKPGIRL